MSRDIRHVVPRQEAWRTMAFTAADVDELEAPCREARGGRRQTCCCTRYGGRNSSTTVRSTHNDTAAAGVRGAA